MFRDVYKSANDDIIPDSELLDKILATKKTEKKYYTAIMRYGSVAAAFFILVGTIAIYPKIKDNLTKDEAVPKVVQGEVVENQTHEASTTSSSEQPAPMQDTNIVVSDEATPKPTKEQTKKTAALPLEAVSPSPTTDYGEVTQPTTVQEATPQSIPEETVAANEQALTKQDAEISTASIAPLSDDDVVFDTDSSKAIPKTSGGSGGGGSSGSKARTASACISEQEAKSLADEAFLKDFGEAFINETEIKIEYNEKYIITR